jgi:hypothetical protein
MKITVLAMITLGLVSTAASAQPHLELLHNRSTVGGPGRGNSVWGLGDYRVMVPDACQKLFNKADANGDPYWREKFFECAAKNH